MKSLRIGSKLLNIDTPSVMGILNLTPDSFYDGGRYTNEVDIMNRVSEIIADGASIIDIGAMSSRPNSERITQDEEAQRLFPYIELIRKEYPNIVISVDTMHGEIVNRVLDTGVDIINDISAGKFDPTIVERVVKYQVGYVVMHMKGTPNMMQDDPTYDDVTLDILKFFTAKKKQLRSQGLTSIIFDPGFGFGKTVTHNYEILKKLNVFNILEQPILVGLSRKSMIYKPLGITSQEAKNGTTAVHMLALQNGAKILRAHDVKEAVETINLWKLYSDVT